MYTVYIVDLGDLRLLIADKVVCYICYLYTPASPHVIVSANRVALTHETKVHSRPDQLPVES